MHIAAFVFMSQILVLQGYAGSLRGTQTIPIFMTQNFPLDQRNLLIFFKLYRVQYVKL